MERRRPRYAERNRHHHFQSHAEGQIVDRPRKRCRLPAAAKGFRRTGLERAVRSRPSFGKGLRPPSRKGHNRRRHISFTLAGVRAAARRPASWHCLHAPSSGFAQGPLARGVRHGGDRTHRSHRRQPRDIGAFKIRKTRHRRRDARRDRRRYAARTMDSRGNLAANQRVQMARLDVVDVGALRASRASLKLASGSSGKLVLEVSRRKAFSGRTNARSRHRTLPENEMDQGKVLVDPLAQSREPDLQNGRAFSFV